MFDYNLNLDTPETSLTEPLNTDSSQTNTYTRNDGITSTAVIPDDEKTKSNFWSNWNFSNFKDYIPRAYDIAGYMGAKKLNNNLYDLRSKLPITLYDHRQQPNRWLMGDEQSVLMGRRAAGALNHLMSRPTTSDGNAQTAAMMEGFIKGRDFIDKGNLQDAAKRAQSAELLANTAKENQNNAYAIASKNRENINAKITSDVDSLGKKSLTDYNSFYSLVTGLKAESAQRAAQRQRLNDSIEQTSLINDIAADMANYGIPATADDQQLITDIFSGTKGSEDITQDEYKRYNRLYNAIAQKAQGKFYENRGLNYRPFTPKTKGTSREFTPTLIGMPSKGIEESGSTQVPNNKKGGKIQKAKEMLLIQQMRDNIKQIELFQKVMKQESDNYNKIMNRAQKSLIQYIKEQSR